MKSLPAEVPAIEEPALTSAEAETVTEAVTLDTELVPPEIPF